MAAAEAEVRALCEAADLRGAATRGLELYGAEIMNFLAASTRDDEETSEAYSRFCLALWEALPSFRWECSFRTFAYALARHVVGRVARERGRARKVVALPPEVEEMAARSRSPTPTHLGAEMAKKIAALRASLAPDDRQLLLLRVNRKLEWAEIARVMLGPDAQEPARLARTAATLRKRFERLRQSLRERARDG